MNICENCKKEHNGSYGSGRFCSEYCAKSYAAKINKDRSPKKAKCIKCGKNIYINKFFSINKCMCDNCKNNYHMPSDNRKCKICGTIYYKHEGGCKNEFCKQHNLKQINTLIKYFGFNKEKLGSLKVEDEFNRIRDIIFNLYWNNEYSFSDIAKKFNYNSNPGNLSKIFTYLKIPVRTFSQSATLTYLNGKQDNKVIINQYEQQWYTTWNNKEVYLRSSYELDYAKKLDEQKIDYEVEYLHIKYWDSQNKKYRCAIPDFYLPKENMIVEIKSSWTLNKQNMLDRMKAYKELGYNFKLICDHKELNWDVSPHSDKVSEV